jgi:hypothetical protein
MKVIINAFKKHFGQRERKYVYCGRCVHLVGAGTQCGHPSNISIGHSWSRPYTKFHSHPAFLNESNDCNNYSEVE